MNLPKISVVTITYGHEKYIRETLDGVLMQQYAGPIEFIITNDNSPDQTDEVVKAYFQEHLAPENFEIKYTKHSQNKGMMPNFIWALEQATGKYFALCEGDDYWTDPYKLQNQVDFLESNPGFTMSFSGVAVKNEIEGLDYQYKIPPKDILSFKDLLFTHYIPTCTLLIRRSVLPKLFPIWMQNSRIGDIPLELTAAVAGLTKYFPEQMAVYRKNSGGITLDRSQAILGRYSYIFVYKNLRKQFKGKQWLPLTVMLLKMRIGFIKDWLGLNPLLK